MDQCSQSSDAGPSNRYEEHLDRLPYLSSDPIQSFTPDLNYRQQKNTPAPLFEVPSRFQVLSLSDGLAPIGKRFMCFTTICQSNNSLLGGFRHNMRPWRAMTRESTGSRNILRKFGIISTRWLISLLEKQKSCVEDVGKSLPIRRRRGMEQTP